jgi:2,3-bisphosphoglycerate-independent phosphoglycerate mutase
MNLVSLTPDANGQLMMNDFTSGHITTEESTPIVRDLASVLAGDGIEIYPGVSYRHVMIWREGSGAMRLTPPHDITGKPVASYQPQGEGAARIRNLTDRAAEILRDHPVNRARRDHSKTEATSVWFWGQGKRPQVPLLRERFGVEGSVISAVDLVNGLGRLAGLAVVKVPGATGFLDTDYAAKARYGLASLQERDFLLLHIEAPDEAGHMGRADLKVEAIERIDELVIGNLLAGLPQFGDFRILLMPDHPTPCQLKTHSSEAVPFAIASNTALAQSGVPRRYTEADATRNEIIVKQGYRLIEALFERGFQPG